MSRFEPKMPPEALEPLLESPRVGPDAFHNSLAKLPSDLRRKLLGALVHDAAIAQLYDALRAAVRSLSKADEDGFRICPDCGAPATKDGDVFYGPWSVAGDDDKLECVTCAWSGDWGDMRAPCVHCGIRPAYTPTLLTKFWHASDGCPLDGWHGEDWEWDEEYNTLEGSWPGNEKDGDEDAEKK